MGNLTQNGKQRMKSPLEKRNYSMNEAWLKRKAAQRAAEPKQAFDFETNSWKKEN